MTTKRRPLQRQRHPSFTPETLALFLELEHAPKKRTETFRAKEKRLMYQLGLVQEFWSVCSVLDRSSEPGCGPEYGRYKDWFTCRRLREQLLAATGSTDAPSAAQ